MENLTAKVSCFARAYHYRNNDAHIFADTVAEHYEIGQSHTVEERE